MARITASIIFVVSCFFTIEAIREKPQKTNSWAEPCVPGRFYPGPDCSKCFCNAKKKLICGPPVVCGLSLGPSKKSVIERLLSRENLGSLPVAADKGSKCKPGLSYRVDCNRCLCLERKSLTCETRRGPSSREKLKANKSTGKICHVKRVKENSNSSPKPQQQDSNNHNTTRLQLDKRPVKPDNQKSCIPGKRYRIKDSNKICTCLKNRTYSCLGLKFVKLDEDSTKECTPGVVYKSNCKVCTKDKGVKYTPPKCREGSSSELEVTEAVQYIQLLDGKKRCTPGVVYERDCNTCICNENRTLDCTQDGCAHD